EARPARARAYRRGPREAHRRASRRTHRADRKAPAAPDQGARAAHPEAPRCASHYEEGRQALDDVRAREVIGAWGQSPTFLGAPAASSRATTRTGRARSVWA